jgi:hypothetical protein
MTEQDMITIIVAIIGAVTGSVSFGILIYKQLWKERPRLSFTIEKTCWYQANAVDNPIPTYGISVNVLLRNKGERNTTIHAVSISFKYKNKFYSKNTSPSPPIVMHAGHSQPNNFSFYFAEGEIQLDSVINNVEFRMEFTHGHKETPIPVVNKC